MDDGSDNEDELDDLDGKCIVPWHVQWEFEDEDDGDDGDDDE